MKVDFRFDKKTTKMLLRTSYLETGVNITQLNWHLDNNKKIYGVFHKGLFRTSIGLLTRHEGLYKIVIPEVGKGAKIFVIENIIPFLDLIKCNELSYQDNSKIQELLKVANLLPPTGYIKCSEGSIYVYEQRPV